MDKKYITKDSGKREKFQTGMVRDTTEMKPRYDLVYLPMLKRWAELMGRGAVKYGERNWELATYPEEMNRFKESAFRHFVQWLTGDTPEEDHAAAVMFNISGAEMVKAKLGLVDTVEEMRELLGQRANELQKEGEKVYAGSYYCECTTPRMQGYRTDGKYECYVCKRVIPSAPVC